MAEPVSARTHAPSPFLQHHRELQARNRADSEAQARARNDVRQANDTALAATPRPEIPPPSPDPRPRQPVENTGSQIDLLA